MSKTAFLCLLALAAQPAWSEQRCDTSIHPLSAPTERFEDNGDGTVTDTASRLVWMRCSAGQDWANGGCTGVPTRHTWEGARTPADEANLREDGMHQDWRLPTLPELAMIAERQCQDPRINLAVFPTTPSDFYWSRSSPSGPDSETFAFGLSFGPEGVQRLPKDGAHFVRLVRSSR